MVVLKLCMWPQGDHTKERVLSVAAIDLLGQANEDRPDIGVRKGERRYRVRLRVTMRSCRTKTRNARVRTSESTAPRTWKRRANLIASNA